MLEVKFINIKNLNTELLIIPTCIDDEINLDCTILKLVTTAKKIIGFSAKNDESISLIPPSEIQVNHALFLGLGKIKNINAEKLRSFAGRAINYSININVNNIVIAVPSAKKIKIEYRKILKYLIEGSILTNYTFDTYKKSKKNNTIKNITFAVSEKLNFDVLKLIKKVKIICENTILARKWVNTPANDKKPKKFANVIIKSTEFLDLKVKILNKKWLLNNNFGALLAVGQGSCEDPYLVTMEYIPKSHKKTILIVGKGVTFDSGGINLKTSTNLEKMKADMSGSAAVIATLIAISKIKSYHRIIGITPLVENMPSGKAICPGDIVKSFSGKTIEIINTDAEGRLILADAISWGIEKYDPDIIIDIASLTGACAIALGDKIAGLFSNNKYLSDSIINAGKETFERCWKLPLPNDYHKLLKSDLADISNMGESKFGGAITAGIFLSKFVKNKLWAHIDIAGPSFSNKKNDYCPRGGTGFGVRLLCEFIKNCDNLPNINN